MAVTEDEVDQLLARASEWAAQTDWSNWEPDARDELLTMRVTSDKPPLTRWMVLNYLSFHAWVWQRVPPPEEVEQVTARLVEHWSIAFTTMDYSLLDGVLARLALWAEISRRSESDQEGIRTLLRKRFHTGIYPELEAKRSAPEPAPRSQGLSEATTESQLTAKIVQDTLSKMAGLPSTPPGFFPT